MSIQGSTKNTPGPFVPPRIRRPRRKITARWYSLEHVSVSVDVGFVLMWTTSCTRNSNSTYLITLKQKNRLHGSDIMNRRIENMSIICEMSGDVCWNGKVAVASGLRSASMMLPYEDTKKWQGIFGFLAPGHACTHLLCFVANKATVPGRTRTRTPCLPVRMLRLYTTEPLAVWSNATSTVSS